MVGVISGTRIIKVTKPIKKTPPEKLPWPRLSIDEPRVQLGVDVVLKKPDIIKLVYKFFRVDEITMEELIQEVFLAIIHKNRTRSAHDSRKSSFGHYVYMVANNVCINLVHKKKKFDKERESLDVPPNESQLSHLETQEFRRLDEEVECESSNRTDLIEDFEKSLRIKGHRNLARYIRATRTGASPEVIREALSWGNRKYSTKTIRDMREQVRKIAQEIIFNQ